MGSKVIKIYYYFLIVLLTIASGYYVPAVKSVYSDSYLYVANYAKGLSGLSEMRLNMASVVNFDGNTFKTTNVPLIEADYSEKSEDLMFQISMVNKFVKNAQYGANVLSLDLKSLEKDISLNKLALKVSGVSASKISSLYLSLGENVISPISQNEDKFLFDLKGISLAKNSKISLNLFVNLSDLLSVNERFYFEIETASDFTFNSDGKQYSPKASYPQKSEFISVVGEKIKKEKDSKKEI